MAHYPFNGNANDESGNGLNGTSFGGVTLTQDRFGNENSAYYFDGADDYIRLPKDEVFNIDSNEKITFSLWFKAEETSGSYLMTRWLQTPGWDARWNIGYSSDSQSMYSQIQDGTSGDEYFYSPDNSFLSNKWNHLVCVIDRPAAKYYIYANSELVFTHNITKTGNFANDSYPIIGAGDHTVYSGDVGGFFPGIIDDVRVYNRALSESEIKELYSNIEDGLVAYYPFNGNANDESGNGLNGTSFGGVTLTQDRFGNENSAYYFDGADDYIRLPKDEVFNIDSNEKITFSLWFKAEVEPFSSYLISKWLQTPTWDARWDITYRSDLQCVHSQIQDGTSGDENLYSPDNSFLSNKWNHLVCVIDRPAAKYYIYANSELVFTHNITKTGNFANDSYPIIGAGDHTVYSGDVGGFFPGIIDDVRVYNRALSESEIKGLYSNDDDGLVAYYPFDGTSDDVIGGHSGSWTGGTFTNGIYGQAYSFSPSQYFSGEHFAEIDDLTNLTASIWFKGWKTSSYAEWLFLKGYYETECFYIVMHHNEDAARPTIVDNSEVRYPEWYNIGNISNWHLYTMTYDGSHVKFYLDGIEVISTNANLGNINTGTYPLHINRHTWNGGASESSRLGGMVDDFRIYNRALSGLEIQKLYENYRSLPDVPSNVSSTDGTYSNKVEITWDENTNATKYTIFRNTVDDSGSAVNISGEITTNFYEDTAVTSNQLYFYWVKAGNADGWSGLSSTDSGYAGSLTALPTLSPTLLEFSTNYITKFVTLGNDGSASYSFDAAVLGGSPWLNVSPVHGTVSVQNVSLAVIVDRSSLSAGSYEGFVDVTPSVGDAYTVTARVEVTAENTVVAEANGPYSINQGSAISLTAIGSSGNELLYKWEVGLDFSTSYNADNFDYTYTNTFVPGNYDVILYIRDTNSPPNTSSDSALLTVNNVSPNVDIGGPYIGETGSNIIFTAIVSDPGILDTHEFRWDFDGDETWDIDWTNLSTVSYAYSVAGNYAAICGVKDNHGGSGSDVASVLIESGNLPPVAQAVLQGTSLTETNHPGLNYTVTLDGSGSSDPDTKPSPTLYFDWREDVNNPAKPVIVESNRHNQIVTTIPLTKIGEYKFHLVVFDGEFNSEPATITVRVPGWGGQVICEGFSGNVPLWGVDVQVSNSFKGQLDSDRTDDNGEFLADAGAGYQIAKLSRRSDTETEIINIDADGEYTENIYFLPTYYIYAGQVVTGSPGNFVGLPYTQTEILIGKGLSAQSDAVGAFDYGMVPESWPLDGDKFKVRFQKQGFKSMVREILLNMNKNSEFIALEPSAGNAQIQGTILSEVSGLPVGGVELDFGNGWTATSDSNGNYGPVEIPDGDYIVELTKTGFDATLQEISNLPNGAKNLDLIINGGEVSVYGQIVDSEGYPVTNATVELVEETAHGGQRTEDRGQRTLGNGESASGAGYYDVTIAKGERTYIVSSPDFLPVEVTLDVDGHTKQDIILPIPEPGILWIVGLLELWIMCRKKW